MSKISRYLLPGFMLVSSVILLVIGVPRFLSELMLVPGTPIYERISTGEVVSDEDLTTLEQSRLQALGFVDKPRSYTDLGLVYLIRAQRAETDIEKLKYADLALENLTTGLGLAPLNTFAWARMASVYILKGEEYHSKSVQAWRTSVATARFEPFLFTQRFHLGSILYRSMSEEDIQVLKEQVALAYTWNRAKMRTYARNQQLLAWLRFLGPQTVDAQAFLRS